MRRFMLALVMLGAFVPVFCAEAAKQDIVATSSREHLWFVVEEQRTGRDQLPHVFRLLHHAAAMKGATVSSESMLPALSKQPEMMAAWGNQLWIVNAAEPNQTKPQREVFTLRVRYDATFEIFHHEPRERLQAVEPLPAEGRLAGFAAIASGPVALLAPTERGVSTVISPDGVELRETELSHPRLLQLVNHTWQDLPLPDEVASDATVALGTASAGDGTLFLFAQQARPTRAQPVTTVYEKTADGWKSVNLPINLAHLRSVINVLDQCAVVLHDADASRATLAIVRSTGLLTLAEFATPETPWTVQGLAGDIRLITRGTPPNMYMQRIDPVTGAVAERERLEALRPLTISLVHLPVLLLLSIAAVLLAFALGRRFENATLSIPESMEVLGPMGRLMALAIDMVPAGLVTMFFLRCTFIELLQPPVFVARLDLAVPYLVMAGLTVLHTGIWELTTGQSLGKSLLHARVADMNGNRLSTRDTLIRIAFKAIVLYVPLLAIFNLMSANGQGLGGRSVGAVVIAEKEEEQVEQT